MSGQSGAWYSLLIWFGIFIGVFYLFILLPQKKKEKKHTQMVSELRKGDKVVTIGGMQGQVARIKDDTIMIKVNDTTELEFLKKAIGYKVEE